MTKRFYVIAKLFNRDLIEKVILNKLNFSNEIVVVER